MGAGKQVLVKPVAFLQEDIWKVRVHPLKTAERGTDSGETFNSNSKRIDVVKP